MTQTLYWHDFEAGGVNPRADRPMQFAGVRTDSELNIIGKPLVMYCKLAPDYLPQPQACLVTGITPQKANAEGYPEADFANKIAAEFSQPDTTIVGYNNIRYDDEMTRFMFYRNFIDPYAHTWQNNNSRWDLLELVRACYALRPEGIDWPERDNGLVSLKLENLTAANGIDHGQAHDALADVIATIEMTKLIRKHQPKLYDFCYQIRRKQAVKQLVDKALIEQQPLVHVSGLFGAQNGYSQWVLPIGYHPDNPNQLIVWRLDVNPDDWSSMEADELRTLLYTRSQGMRSQGMGSQGSDNQNISAGGVGTTTELNKPGMMKIAINQCPFLAPLKTLSEERAAAFDKNPIQAMHFAARLKELEELRNACFQVFDTNQQASVSATESKDADLALYDGFFSDQARSHIELVRHAQPEQLAAMELEFDDSRLESLLFRYRARNWPQTLTESEMHRWVQFCQERLQYGAKDFLSLEEFALELERLAEENQDNAGKMSILKDLYLYAKHL